MRQYSRSCAVLLPYNEVNLIEIFPVAHLHDLGFEVFHSSVRTAVPAPGTGNTGLYPCKDDKGAYSI